MDRLTPYEKNARTHSKEQIALIASLIVEFGFTNPILVKEDGTIIAGHGRLQAAKKLGLENVPVIVLDHLSEEQARALVIADNQSALRAGWDQDLLREEVWALEDAGYNLDLLGFTGDELDALLAPVEQKGGADEDAVPPLPVDPISRLGDVWLLGNHRVVCGDSTSMDDVGRLMAGERAEALWTDPPYNVNYEGKAGKIANDSMSPEAFRQFLRDAFVTAYAFLEDGGAAYVAHADTEGENFRAAFREAGFKLSGCLVWRKNALVLGRSDYQWQHEPILYGWKPGRKHRWYGKRDKTTIQELEGKTFRQISETEWVISLGETSLVISGTDLAVREEYSTVFYEEKPKDNDVHPTMKPIGLIERQLRNSTKRGDVVIDLFGGSGSTLIAAEKLARKARLVELDPRFVDVIVRRWQDFTGQNAYLEGTRKTFRAVEGQRKKS